MAHTSKSNTLRWVTPHSLPKSISRKVYFDNFRIYLTTSNILTVTKDNLLKNYDPENQGFEKVPISKQIVFGVNVDF